MYRFTYRDYDRAGNWARVERVEDSDGYRVYLGREVVGVIGVFTGEYRIHVYGGVPAIDENNYPTVEKAADAIVSRFPAPRGPGGAAGPRNALDAQRFRKLTPLRRYNAIGVARRLKRCGLSSADAWSDGIMVAREMEFPDGQPVDHRHDRCETCALRIESVVNRGMYGMVVLLVCDECWGVQERALSEATRDTAGRPLDTRQLNEERDRAHRDRVAQERQSSWHLEGRYDHWSPVGSQGNWVAVEHAAAAELTRELQDTDAYLDHYSYLRATREPQDIDAYPELTAWRHATRMPQGDES